MNKRISTLFAASLFLSSVFGSAFAEQLKLGKLMTTDLENGETYFFAQTTKNVYGFVDFDKDSKQLTESVVADGTDVNDVKAYLWKVTFKTVDPEGKKYVYELQNELTGQKLCFNEDGTVALDMSKSDIVSGIVFGNAGVMSEYKTSAKASSWVKAASESNTDGFLKIENNGLAAGDQTNKPFSFYSAADVVVDDTELNELYNTAGFNFTLGDDYKEVENIFADSRIKAIKVVKDETLNFDGVKVEDGYSFPVGTYFAVSTPAGSYSDLKTNADRLAYLMECEFIAVNPTENISKSADEQKKGNGFTFTTVSGRALNKYTVTSLNDLDESKQATGNEVSVYNACFTVKKNATNSGKYALSLNKFRYQSEADKYAEASEMEIAIAEKKYGSNDYLTTQQLTAPSYIFSFVESNVELPATFLNADGAAIYNIQFVAEDGEYGANDKYLFVPAYADKMYAKGIALAETNNPEYQFVITNVSGNNVTFTNRANDDVSFTAQLFKENDGAYSLAINEGAKKKMFTILNIKNNGDVTSDIDDNGADQGDLHLSWVKLTTPESTDKLNGTWDVENETKVTLSFARDNEPTSNKLYPVFDSENNKYLAPSTDVAEAAQWQLVKSEKPKYETRSYAYRVGEGEDAVVKYVSLGDTTAYYTYNIQLVEDGEATTLYMKADGTLSTKANAADFVIKDNKNGSVSIVSTYANTAELSFIDRTNIKNELDDLVITDNAGFANASISETPEAKWIKTYLLSEAPEISWAGENGHVTIQSELGNYITMNEERDGIVVNTTEDVMYLHATDKKAVVPSFFISKGIGEGDALSERMFLFNPADSVNYYVGEGKYDKKYQVAEGKTKAIFKAAKLNADADTLTTTIKGNKATLAMKADNKGVQGGLDKFKFQIVETEDADGLYYIRQKGNYLYSINDKLVFGAEKGKDALKFNLETAEAPTSNESVSASEVKVIANNGSINVKNAAGKNVVVSTILGQVVANEVLTSDNATINVPAGIVVVAVEGESFKVNVK